jgi:ABC-type uncharacterized transport system ATPase subunit
VESIADRVAILARGRVVAEDDVAALVAKAPQRLHISMTGDVDPQVLSGISNVSEVSMYEGVIEVTVHGSAREVFERLAPLGIERVRSAGNELDEVFVQSVQGSAH